jgi:hypothetical protein
MLMRAGKKSISRLGVLLRIACLFAALLSAGCGDRGGGYIISNESDGGPGSGNYAPTASAGPDQTVTIGWRVQIDGGSSYDAQSLPLTYSWTITSKPPASTSLLVSTSSVTSSFIADVSGTYVISLVVSNGSSSSNPDSVSITTSAAGNWDLNADAGMDQYILAGPTATVGLDGSGSWAPWWQAPFTYTWSFASMPDGSNAQIFDPSSATPSFIADMEGTYELNLWISNATGNSRPDTVVVLAGRPVSSLAFRVLDAEYSKQLDRIIAVSALPSNQLHIYDPISGVSSAVSLTAAPTSVSVSPDGLYAAVGHAGLISSVDLVTKTVGTVISTTADANDIVLTGNGYAYVFPRTGQWDSIHCIDLNNGAETLSAPYSIYEKASAKPHPGGTAIYSADYAGISPADIRKYDISGGTAAVLYDSPYHGDYSMCGDLWISEDGLRIFTKCGNVFRSSPSRYSSGTTPEDMTYNGNLSQLSRITHLSHSATANQVVAISETYTTQANSTVLQWYDYTNLTYLKSLTLPHFLANNSHYTGHGRFVFYNSLGTKVFVILQADATSGLLNDYGIVTYE